jgi:hypothetical protein
MRVRSAVCALLALSLGGCVLFVYEPKLRVESEAEGWESDREMQYRADATYSGRLSDVLISVRADDPFTPVRARVRPGAAVTLTVQRAGGVAGSVGAWRLGDRQDRYFKSRVPRSFAFGDVLDVPAGTDLLLEFDPRTVIEGDEPASGDVVAFELHIESAGDSETVPVALRVADVHRDWAIGPPTR